MPAHRPSTPPKARPAFEGAKLRSPRSERRNLRGIETLETRTLLTATGAEALNQGILGFDDASGEWMTLRYDGEQYVQENLSDLNSVGRYADPIQADLDGDGLQEVYLRDTRSGDWYSLKPEGSAPVVQWISSWTPATIQETLIGDVTGDGRGDIVTFNDRGEWICLSWNGNGYATTVLQTWYTGDWQGVGLADLDGDLVKDLVGFDSGSGRWYGVLQSNGVRTSYRLADWNPGMTYGSFLVGDLNGDGRDEVIARDNSGSWWSVEGNGGQYGTKFLQGWDNSGAWRDFVLTDLNGDGKKEIIGHQTATGRWWGLFRQGNDSISSMLGVSDPQVSFDLMLTGDITGDGRNDVVSRDALGNFWALSSNGTTSQIEFVKNWTTNTEWRDFHLADFDGDGAAEILGRNAGNGMWWGIERVPTGYSNTLVAQWGTAGDYLYVMTGAFRAGNGIGLLTWDSYGDWWYSSVGATSTNQWVSRLEPPVRYSESYVADVNGDGMPDLVGYDAVRGNWWGLIHNYSGTHNRYLGHWNPRVAWEHRLFADLDGDGREDIAARDPVSGNWWGILSSGGFSRGQKLSNWTTANAYQNVMTIDLEGDGKSEIVGRNSVGTWWSITGDGSGFTTRYLQGWTESWDWKNVTAVDLEGDGREEILGYSALRGEWWELYWTGSGYSSRKVGTWDANQTYENLVTGDLNGDGRRDVATRSGAGDWAFLNFNGSSYATQGMTNWGGDAAWGNLATADLNGDGKDEIVGQNATTHAWWGIFAKVGGFENRLLVTGATNWLAEGMQATDLNQDGIAELTGYDPVRETWWSLEAEGTGGEVTALDAVTWSRTAVGALPGISNTMLRRQILFELPELKIALGNGETLQAARLILGWAAKSGDFALQGDDLPENIQTVADLYYGYFKRNITGMSCGGYAAYYSGILQLFGIDSLDIGFGELPSLSHTTTVIPIEENGVWKFYVLDPTFGVNFLHPDTGEIADYFEMIDLLEEGRLEETGRNEINLNGRDFLSHSPVVLENPETLVLKRIESGNYVYAWPGYGIDAYLGTYSKTLAAEGYSEGLAGFVEMMRNQVYTIGMYGSTGSAVMAAFLAEVQARGIPQSV